MRFECIQNNLINKRYRQDETQRLHRRLEEIKTRKPVFTRIQNLPVLPIIQSQKVARINNNKRIERENQKIASRILNIIKHGKSQYRYHPNSQRLHKSLSPNSRIEHATEESGREFNKVSEGGSGSGNGRWKKKTQQTQRE